MHRARAALAVIAALLGAGQMQVLAQAIEQRRARIEFKRVILAVNFQVNVYRIFHTGSCRLFGCICRRNAN